MSNSITFCIMFLLVTIGLLIYCIQTTRGILEKTEKVQKFVKRSKKWPAIQGKIKSIDINMDYPWPGQQFRGKRIDRLNEKREESQNCDVGGIRIVYEYEYASKIYTSNTIQLVPINSMIDFAHKVNVEDPVTTWVNPKNHQESFLVETSENDVNEYTWILLKDLRAPISICIASCILTLAIFASIQ